MNRLKEKYVNEIVPSLMQKYNYTSVMQAPKLEKIVINIVTHPSKLFYIWILGILGIWLFLIPTILR